MTDGAEAKPPSGAPRLPGPDQLYRLLVEHVTDFAIFVVDPEGRVATWPEGAERLLGYHEAEVLGRHVGLFYLPEDVEGGAPGRDLEKAAREGRCDALTWRVRRDGSRLWASVVLTAIFDDEGRLVGFGQITRDLTDRREVALRYEESRQRYRSLFEHNPNAVFSFGLDGTLAGANPAAHALVGEDGAGEMEGGRFWELLVEEDAERVRRLFALAAAGEVQRAGAALRHRDGSRVELSLQLVPIVVEDAILGVYCIAEDVTERRRAEREREALLRRERAARAEAESASRAKSDFLAVVTHELKTPLNVIGGFADLLHDGEAGPLSDLQRRHLHRIRAGADQLRRMVDDVLAFVRLEAGETGGRSEAVELSLLLREAVAPLVPDARGKGLELVVEPPATPCVLETDAARLAKLLSTLLSNAVKFTERGSVRAAVHREDGVVVLAVSDTGIGIPPEHLERIWEPFWQAEHPLIRRAGGSGLGLSVARRLADLLGGEIHVHSTPGEGSTFTVRLPYPG